MLAYFVVGPCSGVDREAAVGRDRQQEEAQRADAQAAVESGEATTYSSSDAEGTPASDGGTLASDEALNALREKLAGRS